MEDIQMEYKGGSVSVFMNCIEIKKYSLPYKCCSRDYEIKKDKNNCNSEYIKRSDNLSRARKKIFSIVNANLTPHTKFLTLTCRENVLDYSKIKRMFTTFVQSMKREGFKLRYLGVLEHQLERGKKNGDSGAYHIHLVIFNDEYIPFEIINKHWDGATNIHILNGLKYNSEEQINNAGAYVCKYITEEACNEYGSHAYFTSLGLLKPVVIPLPVIKMSNGEFIEDNSSGIYNSLPIVYSSFNLNYHYSNEFNLKFGDSKVTQKIKISKGSLKNG